MNETVGLVCLDLLADTIKANAPNKQPLRAMPWTLLIKDLVN